MKKTENKAFLGMSKKELEGIVTLPLSVNRTPISLNPK
jgi:hypothetical protein